MPEITPEDMRDALDQLLKARARAVAALELTDPEDPSQPFLSPTLPEPATADDIAQAETQFGPLPPSYAHFLAMHDGLPKADMGADLFTIGKMLDYTARSLPKVHAQIVDEIDDRPLNRLVCFGAPGSSQSVFLFDRGTKDENGEWQVIYYTKEDGVLDEYESFRDFILDLAATLTRTAETFED